MAILKIVYSLYTLFITDELLRDRKIRKSIHFEITSHILDNPTNTKFKHQERHFIKQKEKVLSEHRYVLCPLKSQVFERAKRKTLYRTAGEVNPQQNGGSRIAI